MYDPDFEATVAEIRGFDLGDGAQLLEDLDARLGKGLSGEQWLLRAVLLHLAGRDDDALECLDEVIERGHQPARALYLKSCLLRDAERVGEALEALHEAAERVGEDDSLSPASLDHAQGLLFWRVGNLDEALQHVTRALEREPGSAAGWLHRGQLLAEAGRVDEAVESLGRALTEAQDVGRAMFERAAIEAARGDAGQTAHWLAMAVRLDPEHLSRALEDPRFAELREHAAVAEVLAPGLPADLAWLDDFATWMPALRRNLALGRAGVEWLGEAESQALSDALRAEYDEGPLGTMHTEATLAHSRELLATRRVVARGPNSPTREGDDEHSLLIVDQSRPHEGLWLALSAAYPPFLWIPVEPRAESIVEALRDFFPRPGLSRLQLGSVVRGFLGYRSRFVVPSPYTGGLEPATIVELDRHFAINPFVESASWGSAYEDDPWPDRFPAQPDLGPKIAARQRVVAAQARGQVWSLTRRTRHSRSYLSIEVHHDDIFVVEVRYRPSRNAAVVEAMNAHFGCDYPTDLPLDVVSALLGFQFDGAADLEASLDSASPERAAGLLYVLSALAHDEPRMLPRYRRFLEHPDAMVRSTIADIAVAYNYECLLEEMSLRDPDRELRAELSALLDEGIPVPEPDPYADVEPEDTEPIELDEVEMMGSDGSEPIELDDAELDIEEPGPPGGTR